MIVFRVLCMYITIHYYDIIIWYWIQVITKLSAWSNIVWWIYIVYLNNHRVDLSPILIVMLCFDLLHFDRLSGESINQNLLISQSLCFFRSIKAFYYYIDGQFNDIRQSGFCLKPSVNVSGFWIVQDCLTKSSHTQYLAKGSFGWKSPRYVDKVNKGDMFLHKIRILVINPFAVTAIPLKF